MTPVQRAASRYIALGWQVVPLAEGTKECKSKDWMRLVFQPDDFGPNDNIGIRSVNGLAIVDEDCAEVVAMADDFLPATPAIYGRKAKPKSKRLYLSVFEKTIALKDQQTGETLIEIRSNHQDMAPPSMHPSKEVLEWADGPATPAKVDANELLYRCRLLATAALWARHYPKPGNRHEPTLALAGALRGFDVAAEDATTVVKCAATYARDAEVDDRLLEVRTTYGKADDEPITGTKQLRESPGKEFVDSLVKIWGATGNKNARGFITDDKNGKIIPNIPANIRRACELLKVAPRFNEFNKRTVVERDGKLHLFDDRQLITLRFEIDRQFHFLPAKDLLADVTVDTAFKSPFHPVRDYLDSLTWDGTPRIDTWLIAYGGAKDTPFIRAIGAIVLMAAVRRVREPGCKFDEFLIVEGKQGTDKSRAIRALCPNPDWYSDDLPLSVDAQKVIERTDGKWIIEAAELKGMTEPTMEHLKSLLSRSVDGPVRLAYDRLVTEAKRQFIFIGTTNHKQFLRDKTGNRRFWPVSVGNFDIDALVRDRNQLWAEAAHREAAGESIRLDPSLYGEAAKEQASRVFSDPWDEKISELLVNRREEQHKHIDKDGNLDLQSGLTIYRVPLKDIWEALLISNDRRDARATERIAQIMQAHGYEVKVAKVYKDATNDATIARRCWVKELPEGKALPKQQDVCEVGHE